MATGIRSPGELAPVLPERRARAIVELLENGAQREAPDQANQEMEHEARPADMDETECSDDPQRKQREVAAEPPDKQQHPIGDRPQLDPVHDLKHIVPPRESLRPFTSG